MLAEASPPLKYVPKFESMASFPLLLIDDKSKLMHKVYMIKPRNRRIIVFQLVERQKIAGSSLYMPNASRGSYTRAEDFWVLNSADDCRLPWPKGTHGLVSDGFELEPINLELWEEYKSDPAFVELRSYEQELEGKVVTKLLHEDSVLALVEGQSLQSEVRF